MNDPNAKTVTFTREEALAVEAALERRVERLRGRLPSFRTPSDFLPITTTEAALAKVRAA